MADTNVISGVEVGNSYSATGHTEHYNLPIYNATDKVSFLVDWNGAMREIDDLLYQAKSTGEVSEQQILALQTALETAQTTIQQITINIDTLTHDLGDVSADNVELHDRVDTLDTNYTELSSLIASMQTLVNTLSMKCDNLDASVNEIGDIAEQAQSDVASLTTRVNNLNNTVTNLGGRVTNLEHAQVVGIAKTATHSAGTLDSTIHFSATITPEEITEETGLVSGSKLAVLGASVDFDGESGTGVIEFANGMTDNLQNVGATGNWTSGIVVSGDIVGKTIPTPNTAVVTVYVVRR